MFFRFCSLAQAPQKGSISTDTQPFIIFTLCSRLEDDGGGMKAAAAGVGGEINAGGRLATIVAIVVGGPLAPVDFQTAGGPLKAGWSAGGRPVFR